MRHFPLLLDTSRRRIVVAGGGAAALARLGLLLRTEARLSVIAPDPDPQIEAWAREGRLRLIRRPFGPGDALCAAVVYAASDDPARDRETARLARGDGALVNLTDDLAGSDFIMPALVDRDPVTIAIGTEGTAPVLARALKADLESRLPPRLGMLARAARRLRPAAETLPRGRARRAFWTEALLAPGPQHDAPTEEAAAAAMAEVLARHQGAAPRRGRVDIVGAGPGDPDLLTRRAARLLHEADVVLHDALVPQAILDLARREALILSVGKRGFAPSTRQEDINALMIGHAQAGAHVVRLKCGDPGLFGRLEEELRALESAGVLHALTPGITAATAAACAIGQPLTARGRNHDLRLLTAQDIAGLADQDWRALARPGAVAAIYMGKRAARFLQGRLMMQGADPSTPVTLVENASHPDQRIGASTLGRLVADLAAMAPAGPTVLLLGLAPRDAAPALTRMLETAP